MTSTISDLHVLCPLGKLNKTFFYNTLTLGGNLNLTSCPQGKLNEKIAWSTDLPSLPVCSIINQLYVTVYTGSISCMVHTPCAHSCELCDTICM